MSFACIIRLKIMVAELAHSCRRFLRRQQQIPHRPAMPARGDFTTGPKEIIWRSASEAARNKTLASSAERYKFAECLCRLVALPLGSRESGELH